MIEYWKTWIWLKWYWLKDYWAPKPISCGLCDLPTSKYELLRYKSADLLDGEDTFHTMKICSECANILEEEAKRHDDKSV